MDELEVTITAKEMPLFNSPIEAGLRALVILEAMYPRACSLSELTWFDHIVVHTEDMGGPKSLHPDLDSSVGELLVRRRLVENSLGFMRQLHLIDASYDNNGMTFLPGDEATPLIDMLDTPYNLRLKDCAKWVAATFKEMATDEIELVFADRVGRWTAEFQVAQAR